MSHDQKAVPLGEALVAVLERVMFGTARFILKKQCEDIGTSIENLTPEDARKLLDRMAAMMRSVYGERATDGVIHDMKVVIARYEHHGLAIEKSIQREEKSRFIFRVPDAK